MTFTHTNSTSTRTRSIPYRVVIAIVLTALFTGACTVSSGKRHRSAVSKRILDSNHAEYDLRRPLTREDVDPPEGRNTMFIEHTGERPTIRTVVHLPEGKQLTFDAGSIMISAETYGPDTGKPRQLALRRGRLTIEEAREELEAAARQFGIDEREGEVSLTPDRVAGWYEFRKQGDDGPLKDYDRMFLRAKDMGNIRLEVGALSHGRPDDVTITYDFNWGTSPVGTIPDVGASDGEPSS
jgi:hypothetical protein